MSLREALEKLATSWASMDCRVDLPENAQWGDGVAQGYRNAAADLLRTIGPAGVQIARDGLAEMHARMAADPTPDRQPSDAAVETVREEVRGTHFRVGRKVYVTDTCACGWQGDKFADHLLDAALEAAYRVDAPRPVRSVEPTGEAAEELQDWYAAMDDES